MIYAINARPWEWMTGADVDMSPNPFKNSEDGIHELDRQQQVRSDQFQRLTEGPAYLASQTGGFFFRNPSDLALVMERSLDDQRGYYLLGYAIDQKTMDEDRRARTFHQLSVRVTRPGVSVRSRRGFLGGEEPGDPATRLADAASPFGASSLDLRRRGSSPAWKARSRSCARSSMSTRPGSSSRARRRTRRRRRFSNSWRRWSTSAVCVVKRDRQAHRLRASEQTAGGGLVYRLDVPVKAPGAYGLRIAAREIATNRFGAANQFVIVPDLPRKRLALSGVVLSASEGASDGVATGASATHPAIRRFGVPAQLAYSFLVFNARYAPTTSKLSLRALLRLLRDGKPVHTGRAVDVRTEAKAGEPINVVSTLSLGPQTSPGDYSLSVSVTDALANAEQASATSTIDFTITTAYPTLADRFPGTVAVPCAWLGDRKRKGPASRSWRGQKVVQISQVRTGSARRW